LRFFTGSSWAIMLPPNIEAARDFPIELSSTTPVAEQGFPSRSWIHREIRLFHHTQQGSSPPTAETTRPACSMLPFAAPAYDHSPQRWACHCFLLGSGSRPATSVPAVSRAGRARSISRAGRWAPDRLSTHDRADPRPCVHAVCSPRAWTASGHRAVHSGKAAIRLTLKRRRRKLLVEAGRRIRPSMCPCRDQLLRCMPRSVPDSRVITVEGSGEGRRFAAPQMLRDNRTSSRAKSRAGP